MKELEDYLTIAREDAAKSGHIQIMCPLNEHLRCHVGIRSDGFPNEAAAGLVCNEMADEYIVYPTGLALGRARVPAFWEFPDAVFLGNAEQACRYATKRGYDPMQVWPVEESRVHGTCVRYDYEDTTRRCPYRMVQARTFPAWAGK